MVSVRGRAGGFTYIGLLILVAILGIGLAAAGTSYHLDAQREKERELLFAGDQMRRAIDAYYARSPGAGRYPQTLQDLLRDTRYPMTQRYLRRIYRDPITGGTDWGLVMAPDGGIQGVYSRSEARPLKVAGFPRDYEDFNDRKRYADWRFIASGDGFGASPGIPPPPNAGLAPAR